MKRSGHGRGLTGAAAPACAVRDRFLTGAALLRLLTGALLIIVLALMSGCKLPSGTPTHHLRITGAQIPTDYVTTWLEAAEGPYFRVERTAHPTWSDVGFRALANGECDFACTDRRPGPEERAAFGDHTLRGRRVAFYGYALYVHEDNPLDSVFAGHISLLFQKKMADWTALAGAQMPELSGPINLYGPRKATRGGSILMRQTKIWFADPTWTALDSDHEIIEHVAADPLALGFASVGFDQEGVHYLGVRMRRNGPQVFPSLEEIESERYGLAKIVYVFYLEPAGPAIEAALEQLFSPAGREAIRATDLWPIMPERAGVSIPE